MLSTLVRFALLPVAVGLKLPIVPQTNKPAVALVPISVVTWLPAAANAYDNLMPSVYASPGAYPDEVVGAVELLLLAGVVASYTVSANIHNLVASIDASKVSSPKSRSLSLEKMCALIAGRPLPTLEELTDTCYVVAEEAGRTIAMCSAPSAKHCQEDEDFSEFYGKPIYLCNSEVA